MSEQSHNLYLANWIEQLDLTCASKDRIGLLGMAFFAGLFFGLLILPSLSDKYGRKPLLVFSAAISSVVTLALMLSTNFEFTLACITIMGFSWSGKNIVGLTYAVEVMPEQYRTIIVTLQFILCACIGLLIPLFFLFLTR